MEKNWQEVRKEVKKFVEEEVYPAEPALQKRDEESKKNNVRSNAKGKRSVFMGARSS